MNKLIIPIIVIMVIAAGIGAYVILQKPALPESQIPYYFIAIHNEPYHVPGGEKKLAEEYNTLKRMIAKADQYNIKLTLMFTPQWADYISESPKRMADLESWKKHGHEIAGHHHSIYHGNWDGYTDYSKEEAEAQRRKQGKTPEKYLGTLTDYINHLRKINLDIKSGCVNDEHDKRAMPDKIIYDTCSGFANCGEVGTRLGDVDQKKGKNEYILTGTANGILRKWLAHYQITNSERQKTAQTVFDSINPSYVYGVVTHSASGVQEEEYYNFLEFLHSRDTEGKKSRTVSEIIEQKLLPEKTFSAELLNQMTPPIASGYVDQGKCGDGICDELEKRNPNLCPNDCEPKNSYEDSPFGISIAGFLSNQDYGKSLNYMKESGASTVRFMSRWGGLHWGQVEPQRRVFDWSIPDQYYLKAKENGLDIFINLYPDAPEWDSNSEYAQEYPNDMEEYLKFVKTAVERYDGDGIDDAPGHPKVNTWEILVELERNYWANEGASKGGEKWWGGTPEEYADLFVKTYKEIKSANPDAVVMTYGANMLANIKKGGVDAVIKPVLKEIKRLIKNMPDFSFVYAIHYYNTRDLNQYIEIIEYTRNMLDKYGFENIPIAITDMAPFMPKDSFLKEQKLAKDIIKTHIIGLTYDMKKIVWAQLSDGLGYGENFEAGLISTPSMSQRDETYYKNLGFYTYKLMVEKLKGSDWDNIQTIYNGENDVYAYKFIKKDIGRPIWVVWWDYFDDPGSSKTFTLDVGDINSVRITQAIPDAESGADLNDYDYPSFFKTETKTIKNGEVTITLKRSPIFVEVE